MKRTGWLWAAVAGLWALAAPASAAEQAKEKAVEVKKMPAEPLAAQGCSGEVDRGLFEGPVAIGFFDADFATGRRACARTEVGLGLLGGAIIDTPDFYGAISGGALVYGSYALSGSPLEVFGALEVVKVSYVQNASLKGTSVSIGQATLGATYALLRIGGLTVAPSMRLMLPTNGLTPDVRTVGVELGGAASWHQGPIEVHGYVGGDLSAGLSEAPSLARPGVLFTAGAQYSFFSWAGVALDLNAHLGTYSYVAPAIGLRASLGKVVGLELGGTLPLWGSIRNDAALGLKVAYRM